MLINLLLGACWKDQVWWQSCKAWQRTEQLESMRLVTVQKFLELEQWFQLALRMKIRQRWKKNECRPLKTSRTWGKMHIPIPKSHFYHRPSAHARTYGKMHDSHPNFEKLTIDFMLRRHYKCAFYTVICGIFITSLLSDLSLRVVTYDRTVVLLSCAQLSRSVGKRDPACVMCGAMLRWKQSPKNVSISCVK